MKAVGIAKNVGLWKLLFCDVVCRLEAEKIRRNLFFKKKVPELWKWFQSKRMEIVHRMFDYQGVVKKWDDNEWSTRKQNHFQGVKSPCPSGPGNPIRIVRSSCSWNLVQVQYPLNSKNTNQGCLVPRFHICTRCQSLSWELENIFNLHTVDNFCTTPHDFKKTQTPGDIAGPLHCEFVILCVFSVFPAKHAISGRDLWSFAFSKIDCMDSVFSPTGILAVYIS